MGKIIKDALILFAITLVAGVLLGVVYEVTKNPIAEQNELAKQKAYKAVMSEAESFEKVDYSIENAQKLVNEAGFSADEVSEVVAGVKGGKIIGFVVTVVAGDGYAGDIKFSVGVSTEGKVLGTSILSIGETPGLGMRAQQDPSFLAQFKDKIVEKFTVVKDGTGSSADDKIDAIGGSTITSNAMTNGINAALVVYKDLVDSKVKTEGGVGIE